MSKIILLLCCAQFFTKDIKHGLLDLRQKFTLAKFKTKKSAPTPESNDSKPKIVDDISTPEIEKSTSNSDSSNDPSKDSSIDQAKKSAKDKNIG